MNTRQQNLKKGLTELNLSKKEIDVLFALLELGRATPSDISHHLPDIARTSIYDQLRTLEQKGLITIIKKDQTTRYQPQHLGVVIDNLEQKKRTIEQKQNALRMVTDLYEQMRHGTTERPGVRIFKGINGIRAVHREVQNARKELRAMGDLSAVLRIFPEIRYEDNLKDFQTYHIPRKSLMLHNSAAKNYLTIAPPNEYHDVRWLPEDTTVDTDTLIWDGHIAIIDYSKPINATIIDNPTIYQTFVNWFDILWDTSEKIDLGLS